MARRRPRPYRRPSAQPAPRTAALVLEPTARRHRRLNRSTPRPSAYGYRPFEAQLFRAHQPPYRYGAGGDALLASIRSKQDESEPNRLRSPLPIQNRGYLRSPRWSERRRMRVRPMTQSQALRWATFLRLRLARRRLRSAARSDCRSCKATVVRTINAPIQISQSDIVHRQMPTSVVGGSFSSTAVTASMR